MMRALPKQVWPEWLAQKLGQRRLTEKTWHDFCRASLARPLLTFREALLAGWLIIYVKKFQMVNHAKTAPWVAPSSARIWLTINAKISTFCTTSLFCTLFGINWRALSQPTRWIFFVYIIKNTTAYLSYVHAINSVRVSGCKKTRMKTFKQDVLTFLTNSFLAVWKKLPKIKAYQSWWFKGRFTRYDFVACVKLTIGLRHDFTIVAAF